MKKVLVLLAMVVFLAFVTNLFADDVARGLQGCCSHHGGVCDCIADRVLCCDGTFSPSCTCDHSSVGMDLIAPDVSGYTDNGIYVYGDLDMDSSGNLDGYLYTNKAKSIYVEGEIQDKSTVEIN